MIPTNENVTEAHSDAAKYLNDIKKKIRKHKGKFAKIRLDSRTVVYCHKGQEEHIINQINRNHDYNFN